MAAAFLSSRECADMRVGINGMGRIGRLALRAAFGGLYRPADDPRAGNRLDIVHINELKGGAATTAHLLEFDSVHGRWRDAIGTDGDHAITIGAQRIGFSDAGKPGEVRLGRYWLRCRARVHWKVSHAGAARRLFRTRRQTRDRCRTRERPGGP